MLGLCIWSIFFVLRAQVACGIFLLSPTPENARLNMLVKQFPLPLVIQDGHHQWKSHSLTGTYLFSSHLPHCRGQWGVESLLIYIGWGSIPFWCLFCTNLSPCEKLWASGLFSAVHKPVWNIAKTSAVTNVWQSDWHKAKWQRSRIRRGVGVFTFTNSQDLLRCKIKAFELELELEQI